MGEMSMKRFTRLFVMTAIVGVLVFTVGCITIVAPGVGQGTAGSGTLETICSNIWMLRK